MVNFSKIEQFLDFMKTFQRNFLIPNICHRSEIFGMCDWLRPEVLSLLWKEQQILFLVCKNVLSYAKYFHCSCHATWLLCKTSTLLVASCRRNRNKLRPDGPLGSYAEFTLPYLTDHWQLRDKRQRCWKGTFGMCPIWCCILLSNLAWDPSRPSDSVSL